jgi:hypothetical protein
VKTPYTSLTKRSTLVPTDRVVSLTKSGTAPHLLALQTRTFKHPFRFRPSRASRDLDGRPSPVSTMVAAREAQRADARECSWAGIGHTAHAQERALSSGQLGLPGRRSLRFSRSFASFSFFPSSFPSLFRGSKRRACNPRAPVAVWPACARPCSPPPQPSASRVMPRSPGYVPRDVFPFRSASRVMPRSPGFVPRDASPAVLTPLCIAAKC